jgi:hypothetical protein
MWHTAFKPALPDAPYADSSGTESRPASVPPRSLFFGSPDAVQQLLAAAPHTDIPSSSSS